MSLMTFREPNQARWVGTRPGHRGGQLFDDDYRLNDAFVFYTVPAGKTLFLCSLAWEYAHNDNDRDLYIKLRNTVPAIVYYFVRTRVRIYNWNLYGNQTFWPPFEILAGYSIEADASAGGRLHTSIFGWEE